MVAPTIGGAMNGKLTIVLLAVCMALGAYLYVVPAPKDVPPDIAAKRVDVVNIVSREVTGFSVFKNDGTMFGVSHSHNRPWVMILRSVRQLRRCHNCKPKKSLKSRSMPKHTACWRRR